MPTAVTTGPTTERWLRAAALMALVDIFTVLFAYDGFVGYAHKNAEELANLLGLPSDAALPIDAELTADRARSAADEIDVGVADEAVVERLGDPTLRHGEGLYYVGPGGWLYVEVDSGRVRSAEWRDGPHTESDQRWQRWIALLLGVVGLVATVHFARVVADRLTLTDEGLKVTGRPLVSWDQMMAIHPVPGRPGSVEIEYREGDGHGRLRLDNYRFNRLGAIAAAVCERNGWQNPYGSG